MQTQTATWTHHHKDGSRWNVELIEKKNGRGWALAFYYSGIADKNRLVNTLEFPDSIAAGKHMHTFLQNCEKADAQ